MSTDTKHASLAAAKLAVMSEVGYVQKTKAQGLPYSFAGEAALIEALRPSLIRHGLTVAPVAVQVVAHEQYTTGGGKPMHRVLVACTYRLTHGDSGQSEDCQVLGEAGDSGDKAAPKAMTLAFKYFLRESFCIETGDDPDKYPSEPTEDVQQSAPSAKTNREHWKNGGAYTDTPAKPDGSPTPAPAMPKTGAELAARLAKYDAKLAEQGLCKAGDLLAFMADCGVKAGVGDDISRWTGTTLIAAVNTARDFGEECKAKKQPEPQGVTK